MKRPLEDEEQLVQSEPSSSSNARLDSASRTALRAELVADCSGPKAAIAKVLQKLQARGLLRDSALGCGDERRQLTIASQAHANSPTPYGNVVQTMDLELEAGSAFKWEYIHPFAFLWYLSSLCPPFALLMHNALDACRGCLSLLLYGDDLTPGNPLRVDGGRKVFAFYYAFLQWPNWMLHRQDTWLCFGTLRVNIIETVRGGVSAVFASILRTMFVTGPANFTSGFFIVGRRGAEILCRASFKGIIADEKGLKEAWGIKGASGVKPCLVCQNIFNFLHKRGGGVGYKLSLDNVERGNWICHTNESIFQIHDDLAAMVAGGLHGKITAFKNLQKDTGINYNPHGLLGCPELRSIISPVDQYFRDFQHTYASNGVASAQLAGVLQAVQDEPTLQAHGITLDMIKEYASQYNLPRCHGRVNKHWFEDTYIASDHVRHFASDVVAMITMMAAFMSDIVSPHGVLQQHSECLNLMHEIFSLLFSAGVVTEQIYTRLKRLIDCHRTLFRRLYPNFIKIKFHHTGHLADDLYRLGVSLSCFPLERKHRKLKSIMLYAFRSVELTSAKDYVNHSIQQFVEGRFKFAAYWLESTIDVHVGGEDWKVSWHAHSPIGEMHRDDVVLAIQDGTVIVGCINRFWEQGGEAVAELDCYAAERGAAWTKWDTRSITRAFLPLPLIQANLIWCKFDDRLIRVILPPALEL